MVISPRTGPTAAAPCVPRTHQAERSCRGHRGNADNRPVACAELRCRERDPVARGKPEVCSVCTTVVPIQPKLSTGPPRRGPGAFSRRTAMSSRLSIAKHSDRALGVVPAPFKRGRLRSFVSLRLPVTSETERRSSFVHAQDRLRADSEGVATSIDARGARERASRSRN
jgi:hypothetical protein